MEDSILKSIKKALGYDLDDAFDTEVIMHINTVFATLTDLGIGPEQGYMIRDDSQKWIDFYGEEDLTLNRAQTYVYLRVRLFFDPPGTSYHINAAQEQIAELEWRLSTRREEKAWMSPTPVLSSSPYLP